MQETFVNLKGVLGKTNKRVPPDPSGGRSREKKEVSRALHDPPPQTWGEKITDDSRGEKKVTFTEHNEIEREVETEGFLRSRKERSIHRGGKGKKSGGGHLS